MFKQSKTSGNWKQGLAFNSFFIYLCIFIKYQLPTVSWKNRYTHASFTFICHGIWERKKEVLMVTKARSKDSCRKTRRFSSGACVYFTPVTYSETRGTEQTQESIRRGGPCVLKWRRSNWFYSVDACFMKNLQKILSSPKGNKMHLF